MNYDDAREHFNTPPRAWVDAGAAGFIDSHLVEELLGLGQGVVGFDCFLTGHRGYLAHMQPAVSASARGISSVRRPPRPHEPRAFRAGIGKAAAPLGYQPGWRVQDGFAGIGMRRARSRGGRCRSRSHCGW